MRANVAYYGTFGYELDLNKMTEEEKREIVCQIQFRKENWKLFQEGTFYRLKSPFEGNETAWMVVNQEKSEAIIASYRVMQPVNAGFKRICLEGLDKEAGYQTEGSPTIYYGDELMEYGLSVSDFASGLIKQDYHRQGDFLFQIIPVTQV